MSDAQPFDFGKFVPGFDFLQKLASQRGAAGAAIPGLGGWIAPTVSVEELDKRISELKAVQFWLDQNGNALKATIQALQVQRMTLATLEGMNLSMAEVTKAFSAPQAATPAAAPAAGASAAPQWPYAAPAAAPAAAETAAPVEPPAAPPAPAAAPEPAPDPAPPARARTAKKSAAGAPAEAPASPLADPMQWWGALTQQFQHIAASALREAAHAVPPTSAPTGEANAIKSGANGTDSTSASSPKTAKKSAVRKTAKSAAKRPAKTAVKAKAPAKSTTAKVAAKKAPAKKAAAKSAAAAGSPPARAQILGWPLPPPFKTKR